ncbi:Magnesium transporter MRS2/LPE10 [Corchorus olitorius]|uniref:Magnesium transporter n=1 Tax=Corchorus olitorius TaxID=93759 RepID=A0A1R3HUW3_9ROSI|nr:Magnesium transporter MRS2/LPE10 [Corchorus olitorius]
MGLFELLEKGQLGLQSWIRIDASGKSQLIEIDKLSLICHCGVSTRDLRIIDTLLVHPPTILRRENAIVVNLEKIRCIITADEVLLVNSLDGNVLQFVLELQKRLGADELNPRGSFGNTFSFAPFEFRALAVAFEVVSNSLNLEGSEIKAEAYPLLDELTLNASVFNLERLRGLKSKLVALTRRTYKIKDEIERIKDDDEHIAEMYSEKKRREALDHDPSSLMKKLDEEPFEASDPIVISCVSPPSESKTLTKNLMSSESNCKSHVEEWELLLQAYFLVIDTILTKLITV